MPYRYAKRPRKPLSDRKFSVVSSLRRTTWKSRSFHYADFKNSSSVPRRTSCTHPREMNKFAPSSRTGPRTRAGRASSAPTRRRRGPSARLGAGRAHARQARRRKALAERQQRAVRQLARRADRQPGDAAGQGRPEGDLSVRLAGGGRRQRRRRNVPGPVAVSGELGAARREAHQQHAARAPTRSSGRKARIRATKATSTTSRRSSPTRKPASAACSTRSN